MMQFLIKQQKKYKDREVDSFAVIGLLRILGSVWKLFVYIVDTVIQDGYSKIDCF